MLGIRQPSVVRNRITGPWSNMDGSVITPPRWKPSSTDIILTSKMTTWFLVHWPILVTSATTSSCPSRADIHDAEWVSSIWSLRECICVCMRLMFGACVCVPVNVIIHSVQYNMLWLVVLLKIYQRIAIPEAVVAAWLDHLLPVWWSRARFPVEAESKN